jgi:hypothetical protein
MPPGIHLNRGQNAEIFNRATSGSGSNFSVSVRGNKIVFQIEEIGGAATALVADLEISSDNGVTWTKLYTLMDLKALSIQKDCQGLAGYLCRLTSTTLTLGAASAIAVNASVS